MREHDAFVMFSNLPFEVGLSKISPNWIRSILAAFSILILYLKYLGIGDMAYLILENSFFSEGISFFLCPRDHEYSYA